MRARITELEAQNAGLETDQIRFKNKLQKKVSDAYQAKFDAQLAGDREKTKYGTIWRTMNAVLTAYPDLDFAKILPFFDPKTPVLPCISVLRSQYGVHHFQSSTSTPSGSEAPSGAKASPDLRPPSQKN